jgi:LAO/AO transport system kinase
MKAGIVEIGDVFAVNKSDRDGADRVVQDLRLQLGDREHAPARRDGADTAARPEWLPPIIKTVATTGEGVAALAETIARHGSFLVRTGERRRREVSRARLNFLSTLCAQLITAALRALNEAEGELDGIAAEIAARSLDPYEVADGLASRLRR